jgi:predicted phosphoribosyltransferase
MFRDRNDAALKLAERLQDYKGKNPLVLGIPRGGVVIASILARELAGQIDVILTRKLGSPVSPELAMGAVDENGNIQLNLSIISALGVSKEMIEQERQAQLTLIKSRAEAYRRIYPKVSLEGRVVIITDDGIATGATMKAAIETVKAENPQKLIVALPVGPPETIEELDTTVDEVICLMAPSDFKAVGQFYLSFDQVEDNDVEKILHEFAKTSER